MRKNLLCMTAMLGTALLLSAIGAAGETNRDPRGPISAQEFGLPPVSPSQFGPPAAAGPALPPPPPTRYYYSPAQVPQGGALPPPSAVYTAQYIAPEGTANFLDPSVAAMTMVNPLPPAPSVVSSGAVAINEARPLPMPSAPYPVPSQAVVPAYEYVTPPAAPMPAPMVAYGPTAVSAQSGQALAPIVLPPITATVNVVPGGSYAVSGTGTNDITIQTPYPAGVDAQSNMISFVVPIQIPLPAGQQQLDYAAIQQQAREIAVQQYYASVQQGAQPFAPVPAQARQSVAAMTPGTAEYLDLSSVPPDSVVVVTPSQVKQAIMQGARMLILDVRGELVRDVEGHIIGDVHVEYLPRQTFVPRVMAKIPDRSIPLVIYCHDGIWSAQAAAELAQAGYRVFHMGAFRLWL